MGCDYWSVLWLVGTGVLSHVQPGHPSQITPQLLTYIPALQQFISFLHTTTLRYC
jgi:hypothetical protein